ncbi:hypothetical protein J2I47_07025 [Fibrella sp. HMF5335]|uniref:Uncharacterized protein n=1 Tax=Fibrella rubiginis TaxID=2817060 RepID=A0A939K4K9_9BACT|nr:hypothetical protein [Fibrella rubiginis]MBO0936296.1 hypothetical protein [Fibrella rubiginis]
MEYTPYESIFSQPPDFEVTYQLYSAEAGGRKIAAYQGIRWNFMYDDFREGLYMIYPEIININTGELLEPNTPIPSLGKAMMYILNPKFRTLHKQRIKAGTRGYFMEGNTIVAVCEVTRISGLYDNPM